MHVELGRPIALVDGAAGKDVGSAEKSQARGALHHEHLDPVWPVTERKHSRGVSNGNGHESGCYSGGRIID
jgi:hypothetical protein